MLEGINGISLGIKEKTYSYEQIDKKSSITGWAELKTQDTTVLENLWKLTNQILQPTLHYGGQP